MKFAKKNGGGKLKKEAKFNLAIERGLGDSKGVQDLIFNRFFSVRSFKKVARPAGLSERDWMLKKSTPRPFFFCFRRPRGGVKVGSVFRCSLF